MKNSYVFYIYKITLLKGDCSGMYYIGKHKSKKLDDCYAGSGKIVQNYYKKYGKISGETYIKDIICLCDDMDDMNQKEREIIGENYRGGKNYDPKCINLKRVGDGGGV
jgi:hypothetical protein